MKKNIAVVGCGYWGKNIVRTISQIGALATVCDHDHVLATAIASEFSTEASNWQSILDNQAIHAVAIAAPAAMHYALAKEALAYGKDVFVEKPLALDLTEARELCDLAATKNAVLMVGHLLQYHAAYIHLRKMSANGDLGRLRYIYSNRLNIGRFRQEEDVLWSFAPHDISMVLGLTGQEPISVTAVGSNHLHPQIADFCTTHLAFASGVNAHVFVSWLHPFKGQKLIVVGDKAMAVFDDGQPWEKKLAVYEHGVAWENGAPVPVKAQERFVPLEASEPLKNECLHFLSCVESRATPRTSGEEGLRVLSVLEKASKSLRPSERNLAITPKGVTVHESAYVDDPVSIGEGTKIWHFSHVLPNTTIGKNCVIGQNCVVGPDVQVGNKCKIQNNVSLYKGVVLEDGVFCGPSCVFTNVNNPRAEIERKNEYRQTLVKRGCTIGANATIVCGHTLGEYSFIAAGAVVANDVPAYALMAGVPARRIGWMSRAGGKLGPDMVCPIEGIRYIEVDGLLQELKNI
jgi:predicted dehydrogenase/serine acetyltransferase